MMQKPLLKLALATSLLLGASLGAPTAAEFKIAVVAPQNGPFAVLGDQVRQGASLAARKLSITLVEIDETCSEGSGKVIADAISAAGATSIGRMQYEAVLYFSASSAPALTSPSVKSGLRMEWSMVFATCSRV